MSVPELNDKSPVIFSVPNMLFIFQNMKRAQGKDGDFLSVFYVSNLLIIPFVSISITQRTSQSQDPVRISPSTKLSTAPCCSVCVYDCLFFPTKLPPNSSTALLLFD